MSFAPHNSRTSRLPLYAAALALACLPAAAQTAPKPSPATPRNTSIPAFGGQIQQAPAQTPNWPANRPPAPATIQWDSRGLRVTAANSSLGEILNEIAARTGARLEGFTSDERVFGEYGPGQARDVLAQLLHGSGYNMLLIGDQGQGTPRQIVLSRPSPASATPQPAAANNSQDSDDDAEPAPEEQPEPQPPLMRRGFAPGSRRPFPRIGIPMQQPQQPQ